MNIAKIKKLLRFDKFLQVRKVVVFIVGGVVVLVGILLLFIPGPAFVVIPAGFAILALEFGWARRAMRKVMEWLRCFSSPKNLKIILYENSLSIVLFLLFLICLIGQVLTGHRDYNSERSGHRQFKLPILEYLFSGHAIEATFENWESEFLQMGMLVILTVHLRQKGAADSQNLNGHQHGNKPHSTHKADSPWPVRKGGWILRAYKHSLSLSLLALFFLSFILHAAGGREVYNEAQISHGGRAVSLLQYMSSARFWFESFQNWQSEFLSVGVLLVFSIFLRESGSPQSKRVDAPYFETGGHEPAMAGMSHRRN